MPHAALLACLLLAAMPCLAAGEAAPFIDAKAVAERFAGVTPQDVAELRQRRILVISMSMGRNLMTGLALLGKSDPQRNLSAGMKRIDNPGGDLQGMPADVFADTHLVHMIGVRRPAVRRIEQIEQLLRSPPWSLGNAVDVVMIVYVAEVDGKFFPTYRKRIAELRREFPRTRFLHCTTSVIADVPAARNSAGMQAFSEQMRQEYRGKEPVYDLGAILSDDFRNGPVMLPEYSKDSTGVHPDRPAGMLAMGKGFVLALRDALRWDGGAPPAAEAAAPGPAEPAAETLPPGHPEYAAVRAILDRNGLGEVRVEGQIAVRDGHVVELLIQELGVTAIPDEIGALAHLERLHCYGDRELGRPFLRSISPAIARCRELRELLLNDNDLETLPPEIAGLGKVERLALAGNRLRDLPAAAAAWARRLDPRGLADQAGR